jgi:hypothetical protein
MKTNILGRGLALFLVLILSWPLALMGGDSQGPSDTQSQNIAGKSNPVLVRLFSSLDSKDSAELYSQIDHFISSLPKNTVYDQVQYIPCSKKTDNSTDQNIDNFYKGMSLFYIALKNIKASKKVLQEAFYFVSHSIRDEYIDPLASSSALTAFLNTHNIDINLFNNELKSFRVKDEYIHNRSINCSDDIEYPATIKIYGDLSADPGDNRIYFHKTYSSTYSVFNDINEYFSDIIRHIYSFSNDTEPRVMEPPKDKGI